MANWQIDTDYVTRILAEMVKINSINPDLQAGGPGEAEMAAWLVEHCRGMGLEVQVVDSAPGRPNVYARWPGSGGGKSLVLTGHTDIVQVTNMTIPPLEPRIEDNKLYGRGSFDMKAGLASMLGAVKALQEGGFQPKGDITLAFVTDEEFSSLGTTQMVKDLKPDAAILTEPTQVQIGLAHRGFAWVTVKTRGKAAHGSLFDEGIDAIAHMGRLLNEMDRIDREEMPKRSHPMLGRPSLHASLIEGGIGLSTYPESCTVKVEHRPLPDDTADDIKAIWKGAIDKLSAADPKFSAEATVELFQPGWENTREAPIVQAVDAAYQAALGEPPTYRGTFGWLDSAIMGLAGWQVVVFGPGGDGAHAAVEWADLPMLAQCTAVLAEATAQWTG
jgi:acetylornithine deacetylase